ncbi:MAG: hypothetical protein QM696_06330 [Steroidobacteraceae bacterium]
MYYADPGTPDISGLWELAPDILDRPDYRRWIVDGKVISDTLSLKHGKQADGGIGGAPGSDATLPYTPPYMEVLNRRNKFEEEGNPIAKGSTYCWPPGPVAVYFTGPQTIVTPKGLLTGNPMSITQTPGRVQVVYAVDEQVRNIYTDGRSHPDLSEYEPTLQGHSIGHWEGDTLVVDTVGARKEQTLSSGNEPHSDALHIIERIRRDEGELDIHMTIDDAKALAKPVEMKMRFRARAEPLPEYFCTENNLTRPDENGFVYTPLMPEKSAGWDLPDD